MKEGRAPQFTATNGFSWRADSSWIAWANNSFPVKGLQEVYRVLRPGGKAMIGGGAGSGYPREAAEELIRSREEKLDGEEAEKWTRFIELRRPEKMREWAKQAKIPEFEIAGKGAISADDPKVGQGVWLWFTKRE